MSEEIDGINISKALNHLRDHSTHLARAKATRIYLEQFRKSKKALLMNEIEGPQHVRESYAYSHPEYIQLLEDYRDSVSEEESEKWLMTAAQLKVEVYRTQQANNRFIDRAHT